MAQPYDLSGIARLQTTIAQMLRDQASGAVKFAGGYATWVPAPTGWFQAIVTVGGSLTPTTTNLARISLRGVRATLDILASGTGTLAANVIQTDTPPTLLLETGRLTTGPTYALGPLVNSPQFIASTNYDLSGITALQTTVNQMLADQQSGATSFVGNASFEALFLTGAAAQSTNIQAALALYRAVQARFDLLDQ